MNTTSASLLERLRRPDSRDAWSRFIHLYTPLLHHWACRLGLPRQDAADLVQEVLTRLVQQLPHFAYDRQERFRGWLWTVT
ncbi:MAG TPA: sigma factor, partial [Gemmataceae bacterium]|nr:sigma factor [Gemmataceae bacterium]